MSPRQPALPRLGGTTSPWEQPGSVGTACKDLTWGCGGTSRGTSGYSSAVLGARGVHEDGAPASPTGLVDPMAGEGGELVTEYVSV